MYLDFVGKVIPFDRGAREGKIIRLVPKRAKSGSLEKRIGRQGRAGAAVVRAAEERLTNAARGIQPLH